MLKELIESGTPHAVIGYGVYLKGTNILTGTAYDVIIKKDGKRRGFSCTALFKKIHLHTLTILERKEFSSLMNLYHEKPMPGGVVYELPGMDFKASIKKPLDKQAEKL